MDFEHLEEFYAVRESVYEGLHSGLYVKGDTGWPLCRFLVGCWLKTKLPPGS